MANKKLFKTIGAVAAGAVMFTVPSCTDTWDDHYSNQGTMAGQDLWEQITNDPNLSTFAEIASKAKYYKDDIHPVEGYTFEDVLKSGRVMTVWAPENSAFTAADKQRLLDMCENDGYNLQVQFMSNHIALWRHPVSIAKKDTLFMINGKEMVFDKTASVPTMYGVELAKSNIPASNGTLHTLKGELPFFYNLYEYIKFSGEVPEYSRYVVAKDSTYFSEGSSIEGLPDENGNPTYVDSVYAFTNLLFSYTANPNGSTSDKRIMSEKGIGAMLSYEGGEYVMVVPTDEAWNAAKELLKPYYHYETSYIDRDKSTARNVVMRDSENPDSLTKLSMEMDIATPLAFNIDNQGRIGGEEGAPWILEDFVNTKGKGGDYFYTSRGDTIRSIGDWDKAELFNGQLTKMSNGYAFVADKWAFPREFYHPDIEIKTAGWQFYQFEETGKGSVLYQSFVNSQMPKVVAKYGRVSRDYFYYMSPSGTTKPEGNLILRGNYDLAYNPNAEVMSGTYDVYMVLVPYWYKELVDRQDSAFTADILDSAFVDSVASKNMNKIKLQITYDNGTRNGAKTKAVSVDWNKPLKVDTVLCMPDVEIPCSYKNLEHSYPIMNIVSDASNSDVRKGYIRELCIDRVILKSKDNGSVVEIDPSNRKRQ